MSNATALPLSGAPSHQDQIIALQQAEIGSLNRELAIVKQQAISLEQICMLLLSPVQDSSVKKTSANRIIAHLKQQTKTIANLTQQVEGQQKVIALYKEKLNLLTKKLSEEKSYK